LDRFIGAVNPFKTFPGRFNVRIPAELHASVVSAATAQGKSLNQWISEALEREVIGGSVEFSPSSPHSRPYQ